MYCEACGRSFSFFGFVRVRHTLESETASRTLKGVQTVTDRWLALADAQIAEGDNRGCFEVKSV